jgi:hypothetical protein
MTAPDKRIFYLVSGSARHRAKSVIDDPIYAGFKVTVAPPAKTRPQEERYHAMVGDIAKQFTLHGRLWDSESMKRLLVDQFHRDTKNDPDLKQEWLDMGHIEMCPSIDRSGIVVLNFLTRNFSKKLAGAFIEWLFAFGVENEIEWTDE